MYNNLRFFKGLDYDLNLEQDSNGIWNGVVFLPEVSVGLYETINMFIVEECIFNGDPLINTPVGDASWSYGFQFEWEDNVQKKVNGDNSHSTDIIMFGIDDEGNQPVIKEYKEQYPELLEKKDFILSEVEAEEKQFLTTLEKGLKEFDKLLAGFQIAFERSGKKVTQIAFYHFGRLVSYSIIGFVFGLLGKGLYIFGLQQQLSIIIGVLMIIVVIIPYNTFNKYNFSKPIFKFILLICFLCFSTKNTSQEFSAIDTHLASLPTQNYSSIEQLHNQIIEPRYNEEQKVYAIAKFITNTIAYGKRARKPLNTINSREGVCQDYAELFIALCELSSIENNYVTGDGKTSTEDIGFYSSNHAWNIVKVNEQYQIYD